MGALALATVFWKVSTILDILLFKSKRRDLYIPRNESNDTFQAYHEEQVGAEEEQLYHLASGSGITKPCYIEGGLQI